MLNIETDKIGFCLLIPLKREQLMELSTLVNLHIIFLVKNSYIFLEVALFFSFLQCLFDDCALRTDYRSLLFFYI